GDGRTDLALLSRQVPDINTPLGHTLSILYNRTCPRGDANCDSNSNPADLNAFVLGLLDPAAYAAAHPLCATYSSDMDGDGLVKGRDIQLFVSRLLSAAPTGACCISLWPYCEIRSAASCAQWGGTYRGDGTICETAACTGACCNSFDGACIQISGANCIAAGRSYGGDGSVCGAGSCVPTGGCCDLNDGTCTVTTEAFCTSNGRIYQGDGTACGQPPCPFGRYKNTVSPIQSFVVGGPGMVLADDMTLAGTGARDLVYLDLVVYGNGGGAFDTTVTLWTDCPDAPGA